MELAIPGQVEHIIEQLGENGYEAFAVGGCVRDLLLGRTPEDWDITTSARPEDVKRIFRRTIDTGIEHGTVTVMIGETGYEVTTYRVDGEYEDHRHPKAVQFTAELVEDLRRRDFTINAMAYAPGSGVIDVFSGREDMEKGMIRAVGVAHERFEEDALRMLRAVRFSGQLGFRIEGKTKQAICELAHTISHVSVERIRVELTKLLLSREPERLLEAYEAGLTKIILPEFDQMIETEQENPHHYLNVGRHTLAVIKQINHLAKREQLDKKQWVALCFAGLLHDVSKPECKTVDRDGIAHFYGHDKKGSERAGHILRRLKFDNYTIDFVKRLVNYHDERFEGGKKSLRRIMNRMGREYVPYLFLLQEADLLGQSTYMQQEKLGALEHAKILYGQINEADEAVSLSDLAIGGKELMELGIRKGPEIGKMLNELMSIVLEEPQKNKPEILVAIVKERIG